MDWADRMEGPSDDKEQFYRQLFEQLMSEHGTGWIMSMVSAEADTMDEIGVGDSALIGMLVGGASMVVIDDDGPHSVVDPDHLWMFTFAASIEALHEIEKVVQQTIRTLEAKDALRGIVAEAGDDDLGESN